MTTPRPSKIDTFPDYNEAKRHIRAAAASNAFVWVEAETRAPDVLVYPKRGNEIAYAVHASRNAGDVPEFAVEVYEQGSLARYESSLGVISERAMMSEEQRTLALRATRAKVEVESQSQAPEQRMRSYAP